MSTHQGYFNSGVFPYAAMSMIGRDDLDSIRSIIEDHIQQVYGDVSSDMSDEMKEDIGRIIELEVVKAPFITHKEEVEKQLKQYYLN